MWGARPVVQLPVEIQVGQLERVLFEEIAFGRQQQFADGLIAYEGKWLGGDTFVSFDKKAVPLLSGQGEAARLLS